MVLRIPPGRFGSLRCTLFTHRKGGALGLQQAAFTLQAAALLTCKADSILHRGPAGGVQ
jgi:hypothetical protein